MHIESHLIVKAVIAYIIANPHACDNEEGIERWWLSDSIQSSLDVVDALDWLVLHRCLETVTAADGRMRYRRLATDDSLKATLADIAAEINQRST
jgi:hypothetical protein